MFAPLFDELFDDFAGYPSFPAYHNHHHHRFYPATWAARPHLHLLPATPDWGELLPWHLDVPSALSHWLTGGDAAALGSRRRAQLQQQQLQKLKQLKQKQQLLKRATKPDSQAEKPADATEAEPHDQQPDDGADEVKEDRLAASEMEVDEVEADGSGSSSSSSDDDDDDDNEAEENENADEDKDGVIQQESATTADAEEDAGATDAGAPSDASSAETARKQPNNTKTGKKKQSKKKQRGQQTAVVPAEAATGGNELVGQKRRPLQDLFSWATTPGALLRWPGAAAAAANELVPRLPKMEVKDLEKEVQLRFELPGIRKEDCRVELDEDRLMISGRSEQRQETRAEDGSIRSSMSSNRSFQRSIRLPLQQLDAGKVEARFEDGLLQVTIPKLELDAKPQVKRIKIQ